MALRAGPSTSRSRGHNSLRQRSRAHHLHADLLSPHHQPWALTSTLTLTLTLTASRYCACLRSDFKGPWDSFGKESTECRRSAVRNRTAVINNAYLHAKHNAQAMARPKQVR